MIGRQVSHFRILDQIGEGGMGLVFRAEDERLGRIVALKVLPPQFLADPDRRLRFLREARLAAAVTHPNIATIHEIDEWEEGVFIAMELVTGTTLRSVVGSRRMPVAETLRLALQMAEALSAAHQARVVHRDLKPDNVMVTPDGHVKLLDFGLAKLLDDPREPQGPRPPAGTAGDDASTRTKLQEEKTEAGRVLGTPAYMSPEQARGLELDPRSDLFSYGVVLYEMATGSAPFKRTTSMDTLAAILREQPTPPVEINPEVPPELERIIGKCLEKEPADRYQDARDLAVDLRRLKRNAESSPLADSGQGTSGIRNQPVDRSVVAGRGLRAAAALLGLGIVVIGVWTLWPRSAQSHEPKQWQVTGNPLEDPVLGGDISPDGRYVAYHDRTGIHVQRVDSGETRPLNLPAGFVVVGDFDWLPDASGFIFSGSAARDLPIGVWTVSLLGGAPRKIFEGQVINSFMSPDGTLQAYTPEPGVIWISGPQGESPRRLSLGPDAQSLYLLGWSPTNRRLALMKWTGQRDLTVVSRDLEGGDEREMLPPDPRLWAPAGGWSATCWLKDGRFIYTLTEPAPNEDDTNLWAVDVDPETGKPQGTPRQITHWSGAQISNPVATADGRRLSVLRNRNQSDIFLADFENGGTMLRNPRRFTKDERYDCFPLWTPDARSLIFSSVRRGTWDIFRQGIDDAAPEEVLVAPDQQMAFSLSRDGGSIIFQDFVGKATLMMMDAGKRTTKKVPLTGGAPQPVLESASIFGPSSGPGVNCPSAAGVPCALAEVAKDPVRIVVSTQDTTTGAWKEVATIDTPWTSVNPPGQAISPDGTRLAIGGLGERADRITIVTLADGRKRDIPVEGQFAIRQISWMPASDDLIGVAQTQHGDWDLVRISLEGRTQLLLETGLPFVWLLSPSPDGRHVAYTALTTDSNVWLLEGF